MNVESAAYLVNHAHEQMEAARRLLYAALDNRAQAPKRSVAECGTPSGYKRHKRAGEAGCWACVEAHTWDNRRRKLRNRSAPEKQFRRVA